jgi:hypothetical protein
MQLLRQAAVHLGIFLLAGYGLVFLDRWSANRDHDLLFYLAALAAVAGALVITHIAHEWGHFLGARVSASRYTVKAAPAALFFDFDYLENRPRQWLWMSAGGPLGNMALILALFLALPLNTLVQQLVLATATGQFVFVLVLELPVSRGIQAGGAPLDVLTTHFGQGLALFQRALLCGLAAGIVMMLLLQ